MAFGKILRKKLLEESASIDNVNNAIENKKIVIINYRSNDEDTATGSRIIEPFAYGLSKSGNPVIRAYQPMGDTSSSVPSWKLFRLDRITSWIETDKQFYNVPPIKAGRYNEDGDKSMSVVYKNVSFREKNDDYAAQVGPKTLSKIVKSDSEDNDGMYRGTTIDRRLSTAKKNARRVKDGVQKIDLDNEYNRTKIKNGFDGLDKPSTDSGTPINKGPRDDNGNKSPIISGNPIKDIGKNELNKMYQQLDKIPNSTDSENLFEPGSEYDMAYDNAEKYRKTADKKDRYNTARREKTWQSSVDKMYKNTKGSGNRELEKMDIDKKK